MYGTTEFVIDRNTGQVYTIGDIDVTPINLFGGIPDKDLNEQTTGSTFVPPKAPQAMSTPVTEVSGGPKHQQAFNFNDNEYEQAVCRVQKTNQKITTLIKNWNEESKSAKTPEELVEIDMFYRTYMDQYRQRTLERLMEIYVEHYKNITSLEIPQTEPSSEQTIPLPTPRTKRIIPDQIMEGMPSSRRDQEVRETISNETHPKHGHTEEKHPPTPRHT